MSTDAISDAEQEAFDAIMRIATAMQDAQTGRDDIPTQEQQSETLSKIDPGNVNALINAIQLLAMVMMQEYRADEVAEHIRERTADAMALVSYATQVLIKDIRETSAKLGFPVPDMTQGTEKTKAVVAAVVKKPAPKKTEQEDVSWTS